MCTTSTKLPSGMEKYRKILNGLLILGVIVISCWMASRLVEFYENYQELKSEGLISGTTWRVWDDVLFWMRYKDLWTTVLVPLSIGLLILVAEYKTRVKFLRYIACGFFTIAQVMVVISFTIRHNDFVEWLTTSLTWGAFLVSWIYRIATTHPKLGDENNSGKLRGAGMICATAHICGIASILWRLYKRYEKYIFPPGEEIAEFETIVRHLHPQDLNAIVLMICSTAILLIAVSLKNKNIVLTYMSLCVYGTTHIVPVILGLYYYLPALSLRTCVQFLVILVILVIWIDNPPISINRDKADHVLGGAMVLLIFVTLGGFLTFIMVANNFLV